MIKMHPRAALLLALAATSSLHIITAQDPAAQVPPTPDINAGGEVPVPDDYKEPLPPGGQPGDMGVQRGHDGGFGDDVGAGEDTGGPEEADPMRERREDDAGAGGMEEDSKAPGPAEAGGVEDLNDGIPSEAEGPLGDMDKGDGRMALAPGPALGDVFPPNVDNTGMAPMAGNPTGALSLGSAPPPTESSTAGRNESAEPIVKSAALPATALGASLAVIVSVVAMLW
jgi:hypothetical protein